MAVSVAGSIVTFPTAHRGWRWTHQLTQLYSFVTTLIVLLLSPDILLSPHILYNKELSNKRHDFSKLGYGSANTTCNA